VLKAVAPKTGTLLSIYGNVYVASGGSSSGNVTINYLINGSGTTLISNALDLTSTGVRPFSITGLSQAITAGDYIGFQIVTPAWASPPASLNWSVTMYLQ
jgi:hypothetical protein